MDFAPERGFLTTSEGASGSNVAPAILGPINSAILADRGRTLSNADLDAIRALLAAHPELSRRAFPQRLCEHWDWRQPNGALRDRVARSLLLA